MTALGAAWRELFGPQVEADAIAHALSAHPEEACGLVVDNQYIRCHNVSNDCLNEFAISDDAYLEYSDRIQAVIHSHAEHHSSGPSAADMAGQIAMDIPWGLVITNGVNCLSPGVIWWGCGVELNAPLLGRDFVSGVYDCYSQIRSWYWQERQIVLPDFPRDANWWHAGGDLYRENFARAGFAPADRRSPEPGDVFLMQIRSPVTNHGGVYVGDGLGLHHLEDRLSRREPVGPWGKYITHWLRYQG